MNQQYKTLSIHVLCGMFGKTRLVYYDHRKREIRHDQACLIALELVEMIREDMPRIGSKKLHYLINPTLQRQGIKMGRDALYDLLKNYGMTVKKKRFYPRTTWSDHWLKKYPNLIKGLIPLKPNELWVSDITYIRLRSDFAYLSLITDVYSPKIGGYYLCDSLKAIGAINALQMAFKNRPDYAKLIHHSDRGIQYCSFDYIDLLKHYNVSVSMTENGDPRGNAVAERVNGILKVELGLGKTFSNIILVRKAVVKQIGIYNIKRPHLSCNLLTPEQAHQMTGKLKKKWKSYYKSKINEPV